MSVEISGREGAPWSEHTQGIPKDTFSSSFGLPIRVSGPVTAIGDISPVGVCKIVDAGI